MFMCSGSYSVLLTLIREEMLVTNIGINILGIKTSHPREDGLYMLPRKSQKGLIKV